MGEYSVGIATRSKIYDVAKRLFYEQGVKATSYAQISREAEVNKGLIPYYFKTKPKLAMQVDREFLGGIDDAIWGHWGEDGLTDPEFHMIYELLMFRLLERDPQVLRFYSDVMGDPDCHDACLALQRETMGQIAMGSGIAVSDAALQTIVAMVNGTESELVHALQSAQLHESVEDFVRRDVLCCYFLLGADTAAVEEVFDRSLDLCEGLTLACGPDFSVSVVAS